MPYSIILVPSDDVSSTIKPCFGVFLAFWPMDLKARLENLLDALDVVTWTLHFPL